MGRSLVRPTNRVNLIYQHVTRTLPLVDKELRKWSELARQIPDVRLSQQALASISSKTFHCQGGSIFASYPGVSRQQATEFIVAYQTISDYLDNLVDSLEVYDEQAFAQLHLAMTEALDPESDISDYYRYYPYSADGGYLRRLVETCRESCSLPSYHLVKEEMIRLASLYSSLQTYKHLHIEEREQKLFGWVEHNLSDYPTLYPWEFAAATGSTLGKFSLYAASFDPALTPDSVNRYRQAYFPWICGLHILLDYLLDQQVDRETQQLNFVTYYGSEAEMTRRLSIILEVANRGTINLGHDRFHQVVIQGLLALYLSDPKALNPEARAAATELLRQGGQQSRLLHWLCRRLRSRQRI